jgi:hypothetical protein
MKTSQFKLVTLASAMILMGAAGSAHAGSYALSSDNIQGFNIIFTNVTPIVSTDTSSTSAILNGVGVGPFGGTGVSDAPLALIGSTGGAIGNNTQFAGGVNTPVGPTATNYSYADALITHGGGGGLPFNAQTIAESHLATTGSASGTSTNSSATGLTATVVSGAGGVLDFSFTADPLIRTFLQLNGGLFAQGTLSASLTLTCASAAGCGAGVAQGAVVFSWAPDGLIGSGISGGTEVADGESLNLSVSNFNPPGGALNYSDNGGIFSTYHAITNALGAGTYTLSLAMTSTDSTLKAVPEPGTIGLLGLGLAALGFTARRRKV